MTGEGRSVERLIYARPGGGRLQLGRVAVETILSYVQDEPHRPEAGGVLLGRHILGGEDIVVDRATVPMPGDRRSRTRFFRARRRHQDAIARAWRDSGGTCTYLGEWHTHPEQHPTPSVIDRLDWQRKLFVDRFTVVIFFVIVGTGEIRVWEGRRYGRPVALRQLSEMV